MKKNYVNPLMKVIEVESKDIIATSNGTVPTFTPDDLIGVPDDDE